MAMPAGNMFWRNIPARAKVHEHPNYFEVVDGKKRYVANWSSQDAREAQTWLKQRASKGSRSRTHATKRQLPPIPQPRFDPGERELIEEAVEAVYYRSGGSNLSKQDFREAVFKRLNFPIHGALTTALVDEIYAGLQKAPHHSVKSLHATKRKSPAQLDREIAGALKKDRWDDGPEAWQRGYDFAKEASRHEKRAEQREVLRRTAPGASEYDRGFMAGYQDVLGIPREKRSHATRKEGTPGYEVSRTVFGKTRSVVFTARYAAEKFQAAHEGSHLREVQLDENGRIVKPSHAVKKVSDKAIDSTHTLKMSDGRVVTTTWHDTRADANKRIKSTASRDPSHDRVLPGGVLGKFRAVTWSY